MNESDQFEEPKGFKRFPIFFKVENIDEIPLNEIANQSSRFADEFSLTANVIGTKKGLKPHFTKCAFSYRTINSIICYIFFNFQSITKESVTKTPSEIQNKLADLMNILNEVEEFLIRNNEIKIQEVINKNILLFRSLHQQKYKNFLLKDWEIEIVSKSKKWSIDKMEPLKLVKDKSDSNDDGVNTFNAQQVVINTNRVTITSELVKIFKKIPPKQRKVYSILLMITLPFIVLYFSSFKDNNDKICCSNKLKVINQYITDLQDEKFSYFSKDYFNKMTTQLQEQSCTDCNLKERLIILKNSMYKLAFKLNAIEGEQRNIEKSNFTVLSKSNIKLQIALHDVLSYMCQNDICTDNEMAEIQKNQNQLYELKKDF
ncbi:hypothetical protein [Polaribacter vadi]|uniref:hypothetical protein n=1 Tax=Polaribacter vadi TaxID=1774273 RepID=UPI0030ED31E4|tara:strand:+ start:20608 stop:21726 length:1119 start_codon:yes stop_codon:yes gene_type:complete